MPSVGYKGQWVEVSGEIIFDFPTSGTIYAGNIAGHAAVGIMATFSGKTGCWYLTQPAGTAAKSETPALDPSGKPSQS